MSLNMISNKGNDEPTLNMFIFSGIVALPGILVGTSMNFPAISLNQLNFSMAEASWYTSCTDFIAPVGILSQGIIIDTFGRKSAILANVVPHIFGWFLIYYNFGVFFTILGRALTGMCTTSVFFSAQVYIVECITVNHPYLSNNFRTWTGLFSSVGMLLTLMFGSCFSYREMAFGAGVLSLCIFLVIYVLIPESPVWLYLKGRIGDAEMAELKLHIRQPLLEYTNTEKLRVPIFKFSRYEMEKIIKRLCCPEIHKAIIISSILTALISLSGGTTVLGYIGDIINESPTSINASSIIRNSTDEQISDTSSSLSFFISLFIGCILVFCHIFIAFTLPVLGIRILMMQSILTTCFGWILLGFTSLQVQSRFLHITSIWIIIFGFHSGTLSAPIAILSDLFPIDMKGAACFPILSLTLASGLTLKMYPYIHAIIGGYLYYIYAIVCLVLTSFVYYRLPETVGKSYEQICAKFL